MAKKKEKLVPDDFKVPQILETPKFRLRMLSVSDLEKDYDAVITSIEHLQGVFGPKSKWPAKGISLEQDLKDLEWHQKEFENRTSFAYTVVTPDETKCLGCVYIFPSENAGYNAKVIMWVRASRKNLDKELFETVKKWLEEKWQFRKPGYPGREVPWEEWYKK